MSDFNSLFETEVELPSETLDRLGQALIGLAPRYERIRQGLRTLIEQEGLKAWSKKHYGKIVPAVDVIRERYPLVIFHGDVGTGKTASAEVIAHKLAQDIQMEARLFKLSTRVRGTGTVGQMSTLINQAFDVIIKEAGKSRLSFLILDEADSLASNRGEKQSHHEDKVAVNTLIQKIDDIRRLNGRVLIFLCTNRYSALDPAIVRRAAYIEEFSRPSEDERRDVFHNDLDELGISESQVEQLVNITGPNGDKKVGFTFSDIRTRLIPEAIARAYPSRKITFDDLKSVALSMQPTPPIDI